MGILGKAIQAQKDGAVYYSQLAQRSAQSALRDIFALLADDERRHEMVLMHVREKLPQPLQDDGVSAKVSTLFESLETIKGDIPAPIEQADVYMAAVEMERAAVKLYEELLDATEDPEEKALYAFLVDQEKIHMEVMDWLYRYINRPNEWVESAEFGIREEY